MTKVERKILNTRTFKLIFVLNFKLTTFNYNYFTKKYNYN